jgi:hypothetical protein
MKLLVFTGVLLLSSALHAQGQKPALTCSPAPCVVPTVQVSEGGNPVTDASITVNPLNSSDFLVAAQDLNCSFGFGFPLGAYSSSDGGSSWSPPSCMRPVYTYSPCCSPTVGYDLTGAAYLEGVYASNNNFYLSLLAFEKSTQGSNWSNPAPSVAGNSEPVDERLAVDTNAASPYVNSVYVSYEDELTGLGGVSVQLRVTHSGDGGKTWITSAVTHQLLHSDTAFSNMTFGKDGTVYLAWLYCAETGTLCDNHGTTAYMVLSKSTDGGNTWTTPRKFATVTLAPCSCGPEGILPNTNDGVSNFPVIGIDNSTGPHAGYLYVAMYNWTGSYMQVQVVHSKDGGNTWSKPVPVAPATATHDQFFHWLSVSSTGDVGVSWLDRRSDPANLSYQPFAAVSTDGGKTFGTNWELSSAFSNPLNDGSDGHNLGLYTSNVWVGGTLYAVWMDTSNGLSSQDVIGGLRLK